MVSELQSLLDLRRDAENTAKRAVESSAAALAKEEEEQERLVGRWQAAHSALARETERLAAGPAPATVAQGRAREGYLRRLRDEANRLRAAADEHRSTALAVARAAHAKAVAGYQKAAREREVVAKLKQRSQSARAKIAARRSEAAASDLAGRPRRRQ